MMRVFISSAQKELAEERLALKEYIEGNALLKKFFEVFLFETMPAADRRADDAYLDEVDHCDLYVGLFGDEYGSEDRGEISPTEREFDRATKQGKTRLIYVKGIDDSRRHPKMAALIRKAGSQLVRRRFAGVPDLTTAVYASLVEYLQRQGIILTRPFEEQVCPGAALRDIDVKAVTAFVRRARTERRFPLSESASTIEVLTHLHLLDDRCVSNAAVLLFGRDPQRFIACSEVRCMHFHGTEIQRPVPFYQIFKGSLFQQVDQAVDFVLSKVNRSVGTRAEGPTAPVRYELPEDVVAEAVVNAVVHRDYTSSAAIQVSVFTDRVEVWNPGELLPPLTAESLRHPHRSLLRNTRIAEALYLAHYIEKYGTGTLMMIRESVDHALPEPRFGTEQPGEFGVTIWRDWLTEDVMGRLGLSERQMMAVHVVKTAGSITNAVYQKVTHASRPTAIRDLADLVGKCVFVRRGVGRSAAYVMATRRLINDSNDSRRHGRANDSQTTQMTHVARLETRQKPVKNGRKKATSHVRAESVQGVHPDDGDKGTGRQSSTRLASRSAPQSTEDRGKVHDGVHDGVHEPFGWTERRILEACRMSPRSTPELLVALGYAVRTRNFRNGLKHLLSLRCLELGIPGKPRSKNQKYRLTDKGRAVLKQLGK